MKRRFILFLCLTTIFCSLKAQQTEKLYLSGTGNDNTVNWDFFCTAGANSGKWTTIPVPSNWELQGFGKYNYGFNKEENKGKEQGLYKYTFKVPTDWKNRKINVVFEGSMTDTEVKINGKSAGETHQGSFYVFRYDISKLVKLGSDNLLEVKVSKHSANQSVNEAERKADFWIFGGIFRPVYLESLPLTLIDRIQIDAKANGNFDAKLAYTGDADKVEVEVFTKDGKRFGDRFTTSIKKGTQSIMLSHQFSNPELWSSEFPNLYTATFTLVKNGKEIHQLSKKIGFRTVEVRERDGVYVNGVKMKFKGVNRHSFYPSSGRTTSKKISIADVLLMKEMNMNAVRMSHYPPDSHFLDVCDSLGLFVMDELAGWHGTYDTPTGTKLMKEMMLNDENHPSIIFWANGNEGGHNRELDHLFAEEDIQKRPLIHPWEVFGGFETTHYREFNYGIGNYDHGHNILMPTEFLHGMWDGGHGAGIEDYWNAMWNNPLSAGGFLWDFADQAVVRTDKNGELDTDGNHGPDGIVGPYHEKEGSFFTIKEVWCPVFVEKREMTAGFNGSFTLENRYAFTNLNQCTFNWKLKKLKEGTDAAFKLGKADAPNIKPFEKGKLQVNLPGDWRSFDALYLTANAPDGKELFTWSFPITLPKDDAEKIVVQKGSSKVNIKEDAKVYQVSANGINLTFDKTSGLLQQAKNTKGIIPFSNGPILQEGVNNFKNFTQKMDGENLVISSKFDKKESWNTLQWTIYPSGWLKMEVEYFPSDYFTTFVGLNFSYPESEIKAVEYKGNGPYRVWKNRIKGTQFGIWKKDYNNSATGETPWQYPEFKGYYSNLYWCEFIGKQQSFKVVTDREDVFLRLFTPKKSKDTEYDNMSPTFPNGDISFMNAISAIGTKTQKPETTGPMGMKNIYYDFDKDPSRALNMTLYFDFSTNTSSLRGGTTKQSQ
ncbi:MULTISPECIES: glycoside hydrolase family 2 protein [unclassified Pedobacter]|uniref:glycoside hydrolase family 2 protein n=1 Tax=unclassified Pedobacter TaxID=2628915 RepID=UPI0014220868|nr:MULTISPECIES: glycoside hydrolase family 2 TIM barrel-domain containing protein [unclassified Pedobacter]NII82663.1 beta-galactosidase/beta-glucuronidase [Pedobacter sp. SG908]NMN36681.1 beta-galactosidase/beta-glucuronidase [Pedobacter sp. SG918]